MRLQIKPNGIVRDGFIDYTIENGSKITFTGEVVVHVLFSTRHVPFSGSHAGLFKGSFYQIGHEINQDGFDGKVIDRDDVKKLAHVEVYYPKIELTGVVAVDLSKGDDADISIAAAHVQLTVHGIDATIVATADVPAAHKVT